MVKCVYNYNSSQNYNTNNHNVDLFITGNPPPNIGDVKLVPYNDHEHLYEAQVFFTDRIEKPRWGAICGDSVNNNLGMAICRQVGRTFSGVESRYTYIYNYNINGSIFCM